jgi:hypothetical protein
MFLCFNFVGVRTVKTLAQLSCHQFLTITAPVNINKFTAFLSPDSFKFIICQYWSCQVRCCCHWVLKCPFLLQILFKCRETSSVACRSSKESECTAVADCFSFVLVEYIKPCLHGNMTDTGGNILVWEYDNEWVNIFILNLWNKLVASTENFMGHTCSL